MVRRGRQLTFHEAADFLGGLGDRPMIVLHVERTEFGPWTSVRGGYVTAAVREGDEGTELVVNVSVDVPGPRDTFPLPQRDVEDARLVGDSFAINLHEAMLIVEPLKEDGLPELATWFLEENDR